MIEFQSLHLKNIGVHKDTKWKFVEGVHVIRGKNASGKSSLFTPLHTVVQREQPFASRKGEVSALGGVARLKFKKNQTKFDLSLNAKKGQYSVSKDGKTLDIRRKGEQLDYVSNLFSWSPEIFRSTVYLNSSLPNPILVGTPTERHIFFEKIFNVEIVDRIHNWSKKELQILKQHKAALDALESTLPKSCPSKSYIEKLESKIERISSEVKRLQDSINDTRINNDRILARERALKAVPEKYRSYSVSDIEAIISKLESKRSKLQKDLKKAEAAKWWSDAKPKIKALRAKLKELPSATSTRDLHEIKEDLAVLKEYERALSELPKAKKRYKEYLASIEQARSALNVPKSVDHDDLRSWIDLQKNVLGSIASLLEKSGSCCPVCESKLKLGYKNKLVDKFRSSSKDISAKYRALVDLLEDPPERPLNSSIVEKMQKAVKDLPKIEKEFDKAVKAAKYAEKRRELEIRLAKLDHIKEVVFDKTPEQVEKEIEQVEEKISRISRVLSSLEALESIGAVKGDYKDTRSDEQLLSKKSSVLAKLSSKLDILVHQRRTYKSIKKKMDEIAPKIKEIPYLEELQKLTGSAHVRTEMIRSMFNKYLDDLNAHAGRIFNSDRYFEAEWGKRTLKIYSVEGGIRSSTTEFSGFEKRAFEILHCIALAPLLPSEMRTNIVILDEMEAGLEPSNRTKLAEDLIPYLKEMVECVIVVTPMAESELYIPNAIEWQVVRDGDESTIRRLN